MNWLSEGYKYLAGWLEDHSEVDVAKGKSWKLKEMPKAKRASLAAAMLITNAEASAAAAPVLNPAAAAPVLNPAAAAPVLNPAAGPADPVAVPVDPVAVPVDPVVAAVDPAIAGPSGTFESTVIPDEEAYLFIKQTSRESYKTAWEIFRASYPDVQEEFDRRVPFEKELLDYFVGMREGGKNGEGKASSTILTTYSLLNGVMKHKYSFNMNRYPRIAARLKVWQSEDVKKKAAVFTPEELKQFCESEELQGAYWDVRKAIVVLAFFGGLRLVEAVGLELEKISACPEGFSVVHQRAKGRTDKQSTKFKVPKKKVPPRQPVEGEVERPEDSFDWAGCLAQYLDKVKGELGHYQGRVFYTGRKNGNLVNQAMGRNMISAVPHEVARFLGKANPEAYTFHSFRRSSATAAADAGATPQQMVDFFGWKNQSMTSEYISTSNYQLNTMADRLGNVREDVREEARVEVREESREEPREESCKSGEKKKKRKREDSSSSSSSSEEERKKSKKKRKGDKKVIIINM